METPLVLLIFGLIAGTHGAPVATETTVTSPVTTMFKTSPATSMVKTSPETTIAKTSPAPVTTVQATRAMPVNVTTVDVNATTTVAPCDEGTFRNLITKRCQPCPVGQYQDKIGTSFCVSCPAGKTTNGTGSTHKDDCIDPNNQICYPGFFKNRTANECEACAIGKFQNMFNQDFCFKCRTGYTTAREGASSQFDCYEGEPPTKQPVDITDFPRSSTKRTTMGYMGPTFGLPGCLNYYKELELIRRERTRNFCYDFFCKADGKESVIKFRCPPATNAPPTKSTRLPPPTKKPFLTPPPPKKIGVGK